MAGKSELGKAESGNLAAALGGGKVTGRESALLSALRGRVAITAGGSDSGSHPEGIDSIRKPRMVFAIDATASRQHAWDVARSVTDSLFTAVPGHLDVALAIHGGGKIKLFTPFQANARVLREAATVECSPGPTKLLDILERTLGNSGVKLVVYIGDDFEEDEEKAFKIADRLRMTGCRLVILHDTASASPMTGEFFAALARRTGGCVLPFDANAPQRLREMLTALASYAAGGTSFLKKLASTSESARLLLGRVSG